MSTCISQHGEYSAHTPDGHYTCTMCGAQDVDALLAEVERLRRWKAEALQVLAGWEAVWEALGMPGDWGQQKSSAALAEVERLRAPNVEHGVGGRSE